MKRALVCLALAACGHKTDQPPRGKPPTLAPESVPAPTPPENDGVSQRLYADDVATETLALSISIETLGGVATVMFPRDTKLPVTRTEVFSTAADDQSSVEVHLVQGERPLAKDNRSLGKFQLVGIPPAPRGVPQIEVTFAVDEQGVLSVRARDRATGATRAIQIAGRGALDQATIDRMLREADTTRDEAPQRR